MNWPDEHYVKVYTRNTVTWRSLTWQGRTTLLHLFRAADHAGVLECDNFDPTVATALLLDLPEEVVRPGLVDLAKYGVVEVGPGRVVMPNFVDAQEATKTERQKKRDQRARVRDKARDQARGVSPVVPTRPPVSPSVPAVPNAGQVGTGPLTDRNSENVSPSVPQCPPVSPSVPSLSPSPSPSPPPRGTSARGFNGSGSEFEDRICEAYRRLRQGAFVWTDAERSALREVLSKATASLPSGATAAEIADEVVRRWEIGVAARYRRASSMADLARNWNEHTAAVPPDDPSEPSPKPSRAMPKVPDLFPRPGEKVGA